MPRIIAAELAFPPRYYEQAAIEQGVRAAFERAGTKYDEHRLSQFFASVHVKKRHLAVPLERLGAADFAERQRVFVESSLMLGERAVSCALSAANLAPRDVQLFASNTVTGIAVPSIEARLMNRLPFAQDCRRLPLFGLGCAAGAGGIARVADYLAGHPDHAALYLCVDLCSLTFQANDASPANLISSALFGDGAGCVLMVGDDHPLARDAGLGIVDTRSVFFPDTERTMGWDVVGTGFRIILDETVPRLARTALSKALLDFLSDHRMRPSDIRRWFAHPGGPAVIDGLEQGIGLPPGTLDASRGILERTGNLSAVSVFALLHDYFAEHPELRNEPGVLFAMGPGFAAELLLLAC